LKEEYDDIELDVGDVIMIDGRVGHSMEGLKDFKSIIVKEGPYVSMKEDKIIL